ncbi:MAG: DUF2723 domain-containing protein [Myxococcota bacterium]
MPSPLPRWAEALAAGPLLAFTLATASGHGHWLDSGEMVAQAASLGISHPPGHPLAGLVHGAAVLLLPFGPVAYRVAVASALLAGLAALFLARAAAHTYATLGLSRRLVVPLSVAAAWLGAGSSAWWFQAIRPEVYALQAALGTFALERLLAFEARWPSGPPGPLLQAAAAFGLALANHHFLAFLLLPAAAGTLARAVETVGRRTLGLAAALASAGTLLYVYLPLRADAAFALGNPTTPGRFWWVVSAEAYQSNVGAGAPEGLGERFAEVALLFLKAYPVPLLAVAALGFYVLLRTRPSRRAGALWLAVFVVHGAARGWLGFVRDNPDAEGYLMPAFASVAVAMGAAAGLVVRAPARYPGLAIALAYGVLVASAVLPATTGPELSLRRFRDTDVFDLYGRRALPDDAVVIAHDPQTAFAFWGAEAEDGARPDVALVPMPFLAYPGMAERLAEDAPDLAPLLSATLLRGQLPVAELQSLAGARPVFVELDPSLSPEVLDALVPEGLLARALSDPSTEGDRAEGEARLRRSWSRRDARLAGSRDLETSRRRLWRAYLEALWLARAGRREAAREATQRGLREAPNETLLLALQRALDAEAEGPLDVTPFTVGAAGP